MLFYVSLSFISLVASYTLFRPLVLFFFMPESVLNFFKKNLWNKLSNSWHVIKILYCLTQPNK